MLKKRFIKKLLTVTLMSSLILQYTPTGVYARNGVEVKQSEEQISIGNEFISREFTTANDSLSTTNLINKRIGLTLSPEQGSEDFLINTLVSTERLEVKPVKELNRDLWSGYVTGEGSNNRVDAKNMFDGDDKTETDYYDTKTNFPYILTVDLGKVETFSSFSYQKRQGNSNPAWGINGTVGKFDLQVSNDGVSWTDAGSGEFSKADYNLHVINGLYNVADLVYANFDQEYTAQYIRLITKSCALSDVATFNGAEFRLYEDTYYKEPELQTEIKESDLSINKVKVDDIDNGKKLAFEFKPYEFNNINWMITYVIIMENEDHFMRSYLEVDVDQENEAKIDYIDIDHFELSESTQGVWSRPDDFKVTAGAYSFQETEMLLGQPIYVEGMFFGSEFPATDTKVVNNQMQIRYYSGKSMAQLREENKLTTDGKMVTWPNVVGASQGIESDVVQTDFFAYIDTISTKTDFRKQYNSWYDNRMAITDESIKESFFGSEKGLAQNGVEPLDSYVVDDGWNNYNDPTYTGIDEERSGTAYNQTGFWEFNDKFPNEFYTAKQMAANFDSSFGVWLGPQGGYELQGTFSQYIGSQETGYVHPTAALGKVICTGSKKYINNLTSLFTDYQERFDIDYWKLDGFASRPCVQDDHDHMTGGYNNMYFTSELWENWTDSFEAMRAQRAKEGKGLFINATCYVNPSPWMLQWVNTVWLQNAGDNEFDSTNGGSSAQRMISGRDNIYFTNVRQAQLQFPLKNIYNHDPIYGVSANVSMTTDEFRQYMMANAVRGTAFWELYFSPSIMNDEKWQVTADVLDFAQENYHILQNAKLFGNAPKQRSVYGYSSWNNDEGIISFRNPTNTTKSYTLTLNNLVGVPTNMKNLKQIQILPYTSNSGNLEVSYGDEITVTLEPYQTIIYQFGMKDDSAPDVDYVKNIDDNTIRIKFDKRIEDENKYTINGVKASEVKILADYRTVELKTDNKLTKDSKIELEIDNLKGLNGAGLSKNISFSAYKDYKIATVNNQKDLKNGENVESQVFNRNGQNILKLEQQDYQVNTNNALDTDTKDYTISMILQTSDKNSNILKQDNAYELKIDKDGYLIYQDNILSLSSKQLVTTVVDKANGKYGTDSYIPTTTKVEDKGKINDGNMHYINIIREVNGMVKMYIDGELAKSSYLDNKQAVFESGNIRLGDVQLNANVGDIQILNRALGYDEVKQQYNNYQLSNGDMKLDKSSWQATADSVESNGASNEGPAQYAIDDNTSTFWHTQYTGGKPECPHWLKIDLNDRVEFDKLEYVSRNGNGSVRDYTIEISDDNENWQQIDQGIMEKAGTSLINFENTITARYLKININSSYGVNAANENIFGAIAEISLYKQREVLTDYSVLSSELQLASDLNENDYTNSTYDSLSEAVIAAKSILSNVNASQNEVEQGIAQLKAAINQLVLAGDNSDLIKTINEAKILDKDKYTEESYKVLETEIENAQKYISERYSQEEIDQAFSNLNNAINNLIEKDSDTANKTELSIAIEMASAVTQEQLDKLVPAVADEFKAALENAQSVSDNTSATQGEIDAAFDRLASVMHKLEFYKGNKAALQKLLDQIVGLTASDYSESSWQALQAVLIEVNKVLADENVMQDEVDETYTDLVKVFINLRLKPNKDLLADLINQANSLNAVNYTAESWNAVTLALVDAKRILDDSEATIEEVNYGKDVLARAIAGLVINPTSNTIEMPFKAGDSGNKVATKTGDSVNYLVPAGSLMFASILIYMLKKKEEN